MKFPSHLAFFGKAVRTSVLGAASLVAIATPSLHAALITDPAGDFLNTFTGPRNGDLDVISAQVFFNGSSFLFTSTMNAPIGLTPTGLYVWGIDRGAGTVGFPTIAPGVTFDSLFLINPSGTSTARDLVNGTSTTITNITISGSTISGTVPLSALPSLGLAPSNYLVNLWPRSGAGGTEVISDFAPNNSDAAVTNVATPEPGTLSLVGAVGLAGLAWVRRRKHAA